MCDPADNPSVMSRAGEWEVTRASTAMLCQDSLGLVPHACDPRTQGAEAGGLNEFEVSLGYIVISRPGWIM